MSGSDVKASAVTAHLESLGLVFYQGHAPSHVGGVDAVVRSSAVRTTNPEIAEAERRGIPVLLRGQLLAELMAPRQGVAIGGAHGKTTTTAMVGLVLDRAGLDPTVVIGGRFAAFGSHARVGAGPLLVAEADESDRSFLLLRPQVAVVTNIDQEHLESYRDFDGLVEAFERFAGSVPSTGAAVLCVDDPHVRAIAGRTTARVVTYGWMTIRLDRRTRPDLEGYGSSATVVRRTAGGGDRARHADARRARPTQRANALAASASRSSSTCRSSARRRRARRSFAAPSADSNARARRTASSSSTTTAITRPRSRRCSRRRAQRAPQRIVCVFQPHRYTRTAHLLDDFGPALALADEIVLTDIYPAGEDPIPGVTIERLAEAVEQSAPGRVRVVKGAGGSSLRRSRRWRGPATW